MQGRYRGDIGARGGARVAVRAWEIEGDRGEMQGRCRGDTGEVLACVAVRAWEIEGDRGEMQGRHRGDTGISLRLEVAQLEVHEVVPLLVRVRVRGLGLGG